MEIQQLRHLRAAANSSSYAQAAKKCFTSRQNVAHSIKALEGELGVLLFARKGNSMELTPEGERAAFAANEILNRIESLKLMFSDGGSADLTLNLAVSINLFAGMPSGVDEMFIVHSDTLRFLELDCEECYKRVCSGEVDAAVIMSMERQFPECDVVEIGRSSSYVVANENAALAQKESLVAADLHDQRLLLMSDIEFQYSPLLAQLSALGVENPDVSIVPSTSTMIHLLRTRCEGLVSIVSKRFALTPPRDTVAVPVGDPRLDWHFYVLYNTETDKKLAAMQLVREIRAAFALGEARWREEEGKTHEE